MWRFHFHLLVFCVIVVASVVFALSLHVVSSTVCSQSNYILFSCNFVAPSYVALNGTKKPKLMPTLSKAVTWISEAIFDMVSFIGLVHNLYTINTRHRYLHWVVAPTNRSNKVHRAQTLMRTEPNCVEHCTIWLISLKYEHFCLLASFDRQQTNSQLNLSARQASNF